MRNNACFRKIRPTKGRYILNCPDILQKYHRKMKREARIKALVIGAIIGLAVGSVIMGLSWLSTELSGEVAWLPPAFNGTLWSVMAAVAVAGIALGLLAGDVSLAGPLFQRFIPIAEGDDRHLIVGFIMQDRPDALTMVHCFASL